MHILNDVFFGENVDYYDNVSINCYIFENYFQFSLIESVIFDYWIKKIKY